MDTLIYHNPACGTSRNTLALIRAAGIEPVIIEYLKIPPSRDTIRSLAQATGQPLRALLRKKGTPFAELGLGDPKLTDNQLLDAIEAHPILLNRPIVVTPKGTCLCRPSEAVLPLLPPMTGTFTKEDGEIVRLG
jgi:arsenate reductase (glutaredoxin)